METTLDSDQQKIAPMSVGDWVITFLITAIPFVNFIMLFVWAFGDGNNTTRKNWAKGNLMLMAIVIAIYIFALIIFGITGVFAS